MTLWGKKDGCCGFCAGELSVATESSVYTGVNITGRWASGQRSFLELTAENLLTDTPWGVFLRPWLWQKIHRVNLMAADQTPMERPLFWAWPQILGADQKPVESVRFQCHNHCHSHKALKWKLIIIEAGCLDKSMAGSPDGWAVRRGSLLSFRLFEFIRQSQYWRIFTPVLVLMEHPWGISAGLSKTLEMFLGLLRSSLTPSDLSLG